jgi:hypothetical protein
MALKVFEIISIVLAALVAGVFWGPWLGLTRSIATFKPETFLAIVYRLNLNLEPSMTVLMPLALLSIVPVLLLARADLPVTFALALAALVLFVVALLVTVIIEVPIAKQAKSWTMATLPANWQRLRDRWASVHIVRVVAGLVGLTLLVAGAVYS